MFLSAQPLLGNLNSLGLRASGIGIDCADPIQRPNDACQFRIDQGQRNLINSVHVTPSLKVSAT